MFLKIYIYFILIKHVITSWMMMNDVKFVYSKTKISESIGPNISCCKCRIFRAEVGQIFAFLESYLENWFSRNRPRMSYGVHSTTKYLNSSNIWLWCVFREISWHTYSSLISESNWLITYIFEEFGLTYELQRVKLS